MEKFANYDCPVCFKAMYLSPRIYQCLNGHIICEPCSGQLMSCPQCRVTFLGKLSRNLTMEGILDNISYSCPNRENGCMEKLSRGAIKDHLDSCIFGRSFELSELLGPDFAGCSFKVSGGNAKKVLEHLLFFHPDHAKGISGKRTLRVNMKDRHRRQERRKCYVMRPFPESDSVVLVIFTFDESGVAFSIVDLSLGLSAEDDVRAVFSIPDEKAPLISWQIAAVPGMDSWKFMEKEGSPTQFKINKDSFLQHCDQEGKLKITVQLKSGSAAGRKGKMSLAGGVQDKVMEWWNLDF